MPTCSPKLLQRSSAFAGRTRWVFRSFVVMALAASMVGCIEPPPPYVPTWREKPVQAHCFDGVPHIKGSKPWVLGGVCCCTPTDELMAKLHADGQCLDLNTQQLIDLYHERGILLATDHQHCNNLCPAGPHVTKGGKCMVPPTPGTRNYEEVITGVVFAPPPKDQKKAK